MVLEPLGYNGLVRRAPPFRSGANALEKGLRELAWALCPSSHFYNRENRFLLFISFPDCGILL